ncbi:mucin-5B [Dromiciops gliroides]|uniref:mucin-5B n=1 Tax=Dromiciops gliroides TaxID=33562 RepID=UPI001CC5C40C|nr:mucin-5B [Dromiciops gliroides]
MPETPFLTHLGLLESLASSKETQEATYGNPYQPDYTQPDYVLSCPQPREVVRVGIILTQLKRRRRLRGGSRPPPRAAAPQTKASTGLHHYFTASSEPRTGPRVTFIPTGTITPYASALNPSHNGQVCSTWGSFHYKTFDGDIFQFPGLCNYVFASHCQAAYEDFNIQIRRSLAGETPTISRILIKTEGVALELSANSVLINGQREQLPYSRAGFAVEASSSYIKVSVRMLLTFLWNGNDSALLELDIKYANQTCGLCGDFNGFPTFNEFYSNNVKLTTWQFGNLQKLDGPTEQCQDLVSSPANNCTDEESSCLRVLSGLALGGCNQLVDPRPYIEACVQDLCRCQEANRSSCLCATFSEYSRQCAHAGGQPLNWRRQDLCYKTCPANMQYQECGSPCADTCSNPERSQLCEEHCIDGCFCPPGTVLDDIRGQGCVTLDQCHCTHNGQTFFPGASFSTHCSSCTCLSGLWQCEELPCPGMCSVEGGSHITTFDQKRYNVHGDCSYVLSKKCEDATFTILGELRRCGITENENCLKSVTLSLHGGETVIRIQHNGGVFVNSISMQLPISAANITIFQPSTYFILVRAAFGLLLQIQLVPLMQVSVRLDPSFQGQMCGLCGNFNQNQADDFTAISGVVEGTGAAFANTWKTQADCTNVKNSFENPCSLSVENENYAQHWCSLLTDPGTTFSQCHVVVNPAPYYKNCMFDTCNCEKSEDCLCAALSSYVQACAARGVLLWGWRAGVCTKYMGSCPSSLSYSYVVETCQPTCRSLSEIDVTCSVQFSPVDGCVCANGTYLNDEGQCVPAAQCPCYFKGAMVALGETIQENGVVCSCMSGKLSCFGVMDPTPVCTAPMIYLDCNNASAGAVGAQCQKSCDTLDVACYNTQCVSGCICPSGLVKDGNDGCVKEEDCPCVHNEATYKSGETIRVDCNNCTCQNRRWKCTQAPCLGTCAVYGDGHFITFDSERYSFEGNCEYTLAQDYCGGNATTNGTFRVITENIPCGTSGVTCSKAIKVFLKGTELIFNEGTVKVVERGTGEEVSYKIHSRGIYMVLETEVGVVLMWDRKTSIFIKLQQRYKGKVCGLCGNYDGNSVNDFTTRSLLVVGDVQEFGNSWKMSPSCPDAVPTRDPCTANPYRKAWAQKQCSIINSAVFSACHSQVDSTKYYEACVSDACACDTGGDCECFCTAVAAYAQACNDVGVCVSWRKPDICPMFCDFYNVHGECDWHYQPCGAPCLKTCRNPSGKCLVNLPGLEGCYPNCPAEKPFFSESQMKCVDQCGCYDKDGNYYDVGDKVVSQANCQSCNCTTSGIQCIQDQNECTCLYEGHTYHIHEVIYNTTDGLGACLIAICGENGEIMRMSQECPVMPSTSVPFTFTTSRTPGSTAGPATTISAASTVCVREACDWSGWYDSSTPGAGLASGDFETFENLRQSGYEVCSTARDVECRARAFPAMSLEEVGQKVECSVSRGLICYNAEQDPPLCHDYEIRLLCCSYQPCGGSTAGRSSLPVPRPTTRARPSTEPLQTSALTSQTWSTPTTVTTLSVSCQPQCQWTEWFDTDYPKSEALGGDTETYDRIRKMGKDLCQEPQGIECQAENYPDLTIEQVGQVVHCDVRFGFICSNKEQPGIFKMCQNYKIRVLCCDDSHCHGRTTVTSPAATLELTTTRRTGTTVQTSVHIKSLLTERSPATATTQEATPITLLSTHSPPSSGPIITSTTSSAPPSSPTTVIGSSTRTSAVPTATALGTTTTKTVEMTTAATPRPSQPIVRTTISPRIPSSTEATQTTPGSPQTPKTSSLATTSLVTERSPATATTQEATPITLLSTHSPPSSGPIITSTTSSAPPSSPTTVIGSSTRTSAVPTATALGTTTKTVEMTTAATPRPSQPIVRTISPRIPSSTEATQTTPGSPQTPKTSSLATTSLVTERSPATATTQEATPITLLSTHSPPSSGPIITSTTSSAPPSSPTTVIGSSTRTSAVPTATALGTTTKTVEMTTAATPRPSQPIVRTISPRIPSSTEATQTTPGSPQTPKTSSLATTSLVTERSPATATTQEATPITLLSTHSPPSSGPIITSTTSSAPPSSPTTVIGSSTRTSAVPTATALGTTTKTVEMTTAATPRPSQPIVRTISPRIPSSTEATHTTPGSPQTPKTSSLATTSLVTERSPATATTQEATPITLLSTHSPSSSGPIITSTTSSAPPSSPTTVIGSSTRTSAVPTATALGTTTTKTVEMTTAATPRPSQPIVRTTISPRIPSSTEATQTTPGSPQTPKTSTLATTSLVTERSPATATTQEATPITLLSTHSPSSSGPIITSTTSSAPPSSPTTVIGSSTRTSAVPTATALGTTTTKTVEMTTAATPRPSQPIVRTISPRIPSSTEATHTTPGSPQTPKTSSLATTSLVTERSPATATTQEATPITLLSTHSPPSSGPIITSTTSSAPPSSPTTVIGSSTRTSAVPTATALGTTTTKTVEMTTAATPRPSQPIVRTTISPRIPSSTEATQTTPGSPQTPKTSSLATTSLVTERSPATATTQEATPITLLSTHSPPSSGPIITSTTSSAPPSSPTTVIGSSTRTSAVPTATALGTTTKTVEMTTAATPRPSQPTVRTTISPPFPSSTEATSTRIRQSSIPVTTHGSTAFRPGTTTLSPPGPISTIATIFPHITTLASTPCQPKCEWTEWFDMDFPVSGINGGDFETYDNIRKAGGKICLEPQKLECRAENYPEVSIDQIGQVLQCTLEFGLICRNEDQKGKFNMCFNYNIRVLCCDDYSDCPSTVAGMTTQNGSPSASTIKPTETPSTLGSTIHKPTMSTLPLRTSTEEAISASQSVSVTIKNITHTSSGSQGTTWKFTSSNALTAPLLTQTVLITTGQSTTARTSPLESTTARPNTLSTSGATELTKLPNTTPGSLGTSSSFQTISTSQTTTFHPSTSGTSVATSATECQPTCVWTDWFDQSYPVPGQSGGDFETYDNIRASGETICEKPTEIQCRAEKYPTLPLSEVKQDVECNVSIGLICRNQDQDGPTKYCLNYHIRVLCCDYSHCPTTPSPPLPTISTMTPRGSSISPTITTKTSTQTTSQPIGTTQKVTTSYSLPTLSYSETSSVPTTHTNSESTRIHSWSSTVSGGTTLSVSPTPSSMVTRTVTASTRPTSPRGSSNLPKVSSPATASTTCEPICIWTDWFDQSYPIPGQGGGDFETYDNIRASGETICEKPTEIQCRAENYMDIPIDQLGQVVECNVDIGLVCRNQDQSGRFKMCFNYHIRVLCCDYTYCPTTARPTSTPYTGTLSTVETHPGTTPTLPTLISTTKATATATGSMVPTTQCVPQCRWTEWFDTDKPRTGRYGGDIETYYSIVDAGGKICLDPIAIECQSSLYPDIPLNQLKQVVRCNVDYGLICRNSQQKAPETTCLNYRIRVQCCDDYSHCGTTPSPTGTGSTESASWTTSSTSITTTSASPRSLGTSPQVPSLTTRGTTPTQGTQGKTEKATSSVPLTSLQSTPATTSPAGPSATTTVGTSPLESTTARPNTLSTSGATELTKLPNTTPGSLGTSPSFQTISTSQTTTFHPSTSGTSVATSATECQPTCVWTDWFDQSYPVPGQGGGDFETYDNIRASGETICEKPTEIQCRAEKYPTLPLSEVKQDVECNVSIGLICRNQDQDGPTKYCLNYHIRVLCCDYSHCPTTPSPPLPTISTMTPRGSSISPTITTKTSTQTTSQPIGTTQKVTTSYSLPTLSYSETSSVPTTHTNSESTRIHSWSSTVSGGTTLSVSPTPSSMVTRTVTASTRPTSPRGSSNLPKVSSPATASTTCEPICIWTDWFDQSYPIPGQGGGDFETYDNIRASGETICEKPTEIQCRAENYMDIPIDQLGQVVECNVDIGLVCRNQDQSGRFKMCFNYHIRVLCCDYTYCPTTARPTSTPYTGTLSTVETHPGTTPTLPTLISTTKATATATGSMVPTTQCVPQCRWTEWFDTDKPRTGRYGGDIETYYSIVDAGGKICLDPIAIECQSSLYPDIPLNQLKQVVRCNVDYGLICRNSQQKAPETTCLNYRIRVQCCDDYSHCGTTPSPTGTGSTESASWTTSSTSITTTSASPRSLGTSPQVPSLTTRGTTPTQGTQGKTEKATSSVPLTSLQSTPATTSPAGPSATTTVGTSPLESTTARPNTLSTSGATELTKLPNTTPGSLGTSPSFQTISTSQTTTFHPSTSGTSVATSATECQPTCVWTDWFDQSYPVPGQGGGDFETYDNIRASGETICEKPTEIQCRAEKYPTLPLSEVKQDVECNVSIGLICRNQDQDGPTKYCLNYHIRVLCCDYSHCPTTPSPPLPTISTMTPRGSSISPTITTKTSTQTTSQPIGTTQKVTTSYSLPTLSYSETSSVPTTHTNSESTRIHSWSSTVSGGTTLSVSPTPSSMVTRTVTASTRPTSPRGSSNLPKVSSPATASTTCEPICIWTDWFDQSYPIPGQGGGDFETYDNIRASGETICEKPTEIQCRAENYMDIPIDQLGQVVECNVDIGLVCRNQDQSGRFKMCFNYHIRVLCCDYTYCPTTARPTSTPYTGTLSTVETHPGTTPTLPTLISTTKATATATGSMVPTTQCVPQCRWTEWFDTDKPRTGRYGGDIETYYSIVDAGGKICLDPIAIECQSSLYPDIPLNQLKQVVRCNVDYGLICRNSQQKAPETTCLNYRIRVQCCDDYSHCGTTPSPTGTGSTESASWTTSSTSITTTSASPRSLGTSPQVPSLTTRGTTPTQGTQGKTEKATSSVPLTSLQSTPATTSPAGPSATTTVGTSPLESTTARPNTLSTSGATELTKLPNTTPGSLGTSPSFQTISTSQTTTFHPSTSGTSVATSATECQPTCVWTDWFDQSYPVPGQGGGDFETYDNIRASGETICEKPTEIQCRAEKYPTLPLSEVKQDVECNVSIGLICRNQDQDGPTKYCLNYHIRVLCCDYSHCPTTPSSSSSTPVSSHPRTPNVSTPTLQTSTGSIFSTSLSISPVPQTSPTPFTLTTPCFCFVSGDLFSAGEVIYNKTDNAGCSFYAICNQQCEIERFQGPCPTPTSSVPSSTVPQSTPPPGCYDVLPPRQPGEQWTSNCQDCICDNSSLTVQCRPVQCLEPTPPPNCQKEGFVIVFQPRAENSCCMEARCVCNQSSCSQDRPSCMPQEELFSILPVNKCCPVYGCRQRMCEHNGTTYGIGSKVPSDQPCHTCTCHIKVNPETNSTVWCEVEPCSTTCAPDQEYKVLPGQCCGQCVPAACLTPDGKWIKFNETWVNTNTDNCTEYVCEKVNGEPILSRRPTECPDVPSCKGVLKRVGCCYQCEEVEEDCRVQYNETLLQYEGCVSETAVNLTFCAGSCGSVSMYSLEANEMQRKCACCQETQVHQKEVKMKCPDGTEIQRSYMNVVACSCTPACLPSHTEVPT